MDPDINRVDQHLRRNSCVYTPSWLQECVEYYKSESSGALNFDELCAQVLGQWCLLDLCEVSIPSLPPQLASKTKFELTGRYTLQVNVAADISTSAYTQYQQLRHADNANLDVDEERRAAGPAEPRGKRMMRLSLTDGVQAVSAVEHQPIKLFDQTLVPGCKVTVTGPVISRRGILFLCAHNITLLGGEVDSLLVPNALENVVARKLGLPENTDPYRLEQPNAVLNIAVPVAVEQDEWGDELWEQDLVQQLPEILNAADASNSNNPRNNANNNEISSYGSRVNNSGNHQSNSTFPSGGSTIANHTNANHRTEPSVNLSSGRQNAWSSHRNEPSNQGWNAAGWSRTQGNGDRANANVTSPPSSSDWRHGNRSPSPQKPAAFTLSDSEDELLQAVDVEAAIRMTQMVRPTTDRTQRALPIDKWNRTDAASQRTVQRKEVMPRHNENRTCHSEHRSADEDDDEREFQSPVSRRHCNWQEEDEDDMDFEPQTCFPRRQENLSPERESSYRPAKPRSRQEAFAELRAKRMKGKAAAGPSAAENNRSFPNDVSHKSSAGTDIDTSVKPTFTHEENVDLDSRTLRSEYFDAEPSNQMDVDVKPEPFKPEPFKSEPFKSEPLELEPMDMVPASTETPRGPVLLAAEPFVYLNTVDLERPGERYVVKATVLQLRSGLKAQGGRWHLDAEIADGSSATLVVQFANAVLETLIGYSVAEMATLKKQIATNPLIKERICEDLQQARQRLVELNCLMTLEVSEESVTVVALTQVKEAHQQSLVRRSSTITQHK